MRAVEGGRGRSTAVGCESDIGSQEAQCRHEPCMDRAIRLAQRAEGGDRRSDGVGDLVLVPHGSAPGRPAHDVDPAPCDGVLVVAVPGRLVPAERDARGLEAVQSQERPAGADRKSTRLNSSHSQISYAVFCLKKKKSKDEKGRTNSASAQY